MGYGHPSYIGNQNSKYIKPYEWVHNHPVCGKANHVLIMAQMSSSASFFGARFIRLGPFTVGLFTAEAKVLKVNMAGAVNHLQPRIQPSYSTFTYLLKITILNG